MSRAVGVAVTMVWLSAIPASGAEKPGRAGSPEAHGEYLVERVGMCQDCHSPRNAEGFFLEDQWLAGAPIDFTPSSPVPWAEMAPPIAGLPTMSHEQAVRFMMAGEKPDGSPARPPMLEYRLTREDAKAVVAYLKPLAPKD